ncbi:unnamed protein product [Aphanomyces euteiches]
MNFSTKRAASNVVQFQYVLLRYFRMYWRTPTYNLTRVMLSVFLAVLFGLIFLSVDYTTYSGVVGGSGMVFMTTVFVGIIAFNSIVPITVEERASYYRERASQTYNALWYFLAGTIVEIPYVLVTTLIFTVIFYPFVGFSGSVGDVIIYWLLLSLYSIFNVYMGQLFAFALPTIDVAMSIGALVNSIFILFMGFSPPTSAIPKGYKWLATITPPNVKMAMAWAVQPCVPPATLNQMNKTSVTVKEFTEFFFEMKYDNGTKYTLIVFAVIILFRILAVLALRYINHQKR